MEEVKTGPKPNPKLNPKVNLDDVDAILAELDPEFKNQWGAINTEISQISTLASLESVSLSADYLKEGAKVEEGQALAMPPSTLDTDQEPGEVSLSLHQILWQIIWETLKLPFGLSKELVKLSLSLREESPAEVLQGVPDVFFSLLQEWIVPLRELVKKLRTFDPATLVKLFIIFALAFGLKYLFTDMKNHFTPDADTDPFLKSWNHVADAKYEIPPDDDAENLENPLRHPEYTVLVHRIVANLKPTTPKATPIIAIELYLEASNQDAAIEIHDRDLEVRDQLERVFEDTTFNDVDSKAGKERLKGKIRSALNQFLTKGHVKRVFFSNLNAAP